MLLYNYSTNSRFYNLLITPLDKSFRLKLALFILETDYGMKYKTLLDHFDINT